MVGIVITIIVVGVLLWLAETFIPMNATIKKLLVAVVVILLVLWILSQFVDLGSIGTIHKYHFGR
jgi:hypothetical protein